MPDSQNSEISADLNGGNVSGAIDSSTSNEGAVDTGTATAEGGDGAEVTDPEFDFAGWQSKLNELSQVAATRAEVENLRRVTGHVPGLMSKLDALEKAINSGEHVSPQVKALEERLTAIVSALTPLLPDADLSKINSASQPDVASLIKQAVQEALPQKQADEAGKQEEIDPAAAQEMAIYDAQWASAGEQVVNYAKQKGIDSSQLTQDMYQKAQIGTFDADHKYGDPIKGARLLMQEIDKLAAASTRRTEKVQAGKEGLPADRGAAQRGTLSLAQMSDMSAEELMKIPREQRDAALRAGV